jgi:hypothetical protein
VIPPNVTTANLLTEVNNDLRALLNPTGNFIDKTVNLTNGNSRIEIPVGSNNYVNIGNGQKFRAVITRDASYDAIPGTDTKRLLIRIIGSGDGAAGVGTTAGVELEYARAERETTFFQYGMASRGQVSVLTKNLLTGTPASQAGIISYSSVNPPVNLAGLAGGGIAGDIYVPNGTVPTVLVGNSVGGTANTVDIMANHVHHFDASEVPAMPVPDTSIFRAFATNNYVAGQASYKNVVIPANINPTFNGPCTIQGVVWVKQPNKVTFSGQVQITGVIASENSGVGTLLTNQLIFSGNGGSKMGVEGLPDTPEFSGLKALAGSFIVAPGFDVQLTGNFGNMNGHIVGDKVTVSGSSASTVAGTLVALKSTLTVGGNTTASFKPGTGGHAGLRFDDRYLPDFSSYTEVKP